MLVEFRVKDFGIIENVTWPLGRGLNVITGETGAGKSLVIDAVEALLTGRITDDDIRRGSSESVVEGIFSLPAGPSTIRELLEAKGIDACHDTIVLSCTLHREGHSVSRLNGYGVPRAFVAQLAAWLVDVHGQSEHLSLLDSRRHLDLLDNYAGTLGLREEFAALATRLRSIDEKQKALNEAARERAHREDLLRFQVDEIARAALCDGEHELLDQERRRLASAEKLKGYTWEALQSLQGETTSGLQPSALDRLNEAIRPLRRLLNTDSTLKAQIEALESAVYIVEDSARDLQAYAENLDHNPHRLEEVEARLELLRTLDRKYGPGIPAILAHQERAQRELEKIYSSSDLMAALENERAGVHQRMAAMGGNLTELRREAAQRLEVAVEKELRDLHMGRMSFRVSLEKREAADGIPFPDGKTYGFDPTGVDVVRFLAVTNPGEPLKPLARIASTGEISRFTLALTSALAETHNVPLIIFDEIDIGVGGRSGEAIGRKLWSLAQRRQVVCVTHLPQIAAHADVHCSVAKETTADHALSRLRLIEGRDREKELAAMLGGPQYTPAALKNASDLLQKAAAWKRSCLGG